MTRRSISPSGLPDILIRQLVDRIVFIYEATRSDDPETEASVKKQIREWIDTRWSDGDVASALSIVTTMRSALVDAQIKRLNKTKGGG